MTKTFDRFLRSFTDDELAGFAQERARLQPPYWKVLRLALRIEADRRGLRLEDDVLELAGSRAADQEARTGTI